MEEEYLGEESTARDLYGRQDEDKEGCKPFVPAAGGDMSPVAQTTKIFGNLQGGEARKLPAEKLKPEDLNSQATQHTGKDEEVSLFHYRGPQSGICSGRIATGLRVCVTHRSMCQFQHRSKVALEAGYYIKVPHKRGAQEAVYLAPHVTEEQAQASPSFAQLLEAPLPMSQMVRLLQATIDGAWEDEAEVVQAFVRAGALTTTAKAIATPCKRVKLTAAEDESEVAKEA